MSAADLKRRLTELARLSPAAAPVVTVYLNTTWADEQQRERARIFLKNALGDARARGSAAAEDLEWVEAQGRAVIERKLLEDASGIVLFACAAAGLRELHPLRVPFEDTFVVNPSPYLRPLASILDDTPPSLVVFVDGTSARLIAVDAGGVTGEAVLESDVPGRHQMGGWAALAQSRYQRHIQHHRDQHYEAVAAAVAEWGERYQARHVVLAGEARSVAALARRLPDPVAARIAGTISAMPQEAAATLAARAAEVLAAVEERVDRQGVEQALTEAAKGGGAVAGLEATVGAVNREAARQLYLLVSFREPGSVCEGCRALQPGVRFTCPFCGKPMRTIELGEALVERVLATGGEVTTVENHEPLRARGGVAARLRYAT